MDNRPNLLVILTDQHNPRFSGPYGHSLVRTPHMDRLAEEGVTFDSCYTNCPLCVPARMSFMTGRYVHNIGVWDNCAPLAEDAVTWAHRLRNAGYRAALSGKMHFRGFDHLHGFEEQLAYDINARNAPHKPDFWSQVTPKTFPPRRFPGYRSGSSKEIVADEAVTKAAVRYLREETGKEESWALVVGLVSPHPPFVAPSEYCALYDPQEIDLPEFPDALLQRLHPAQRRRRGAEPGDRIPDEVIRGIRATYYAQVTYVDDKIGQLIDALEDSGQREQTVVVYTSDHGEMMGEHDMWAKSSFLDDSCRVPLIINWPGRFPGSRRVKENVSLVDLVATLVDMSGAQSDRAAAQIDALDGESMLGLLDDSQMPSQWKDEAFSEFYAAGSVAPSAMLRKGKWKLNYYYHEPAELYDMETDPRELRDLGREAEFAEVRLELENDLLSRWDPAAVEKVVRESQERRSYLFDHLYRYLAMDGMPGNRF